MDNSINQTQIQPQPAYIQQAPIPPPQKSKLPLILGIIALLFIFVGAGIVLGKFLFTQPTTPIVDKLVFPTPSTAEALAKTETPTTDPTTNWKTYTNDDYKISFDYPSRWTILETYKTGEPLPFIQLTLNFLIPNTTQKDILIPTTLALNVYKVSPNYALDISKYLLEGVLKDVNTNNQTSSTDQVKIGDKVATRFNATPGMWGYTMIYWTSKQMAVTLGSQKTLFQFSEQDKLLGDPPYAKSNPDINRILSSFKFL